jgi:hypothetical protein
MTAIENKKIRRVSMSAANCTEPMVESHMRRNSRYSLRPTISRNDKQKCSPEEAQRIPGFVCVAYISPDYAKLHPDYARYAACLISDSAGMPRPLCNFHTMAKVSGRL